MQYIPTGRQIADTMTKALPRTQLKKLVDQFMVEWTTRHAHSSSVNKRGRKKNKSEREREKERKREKRERERAWLVFDLFAHNCFVWCLEHWACFPLIFVWVFWGWLLCRVNNSFWCLCRCRFKYVGVELSLSVTMPPWVSIQGECQKLRFVMT